MRKLKMGQYNVKKNENEKNRQNYFIKKGETFINYNITPKYV